MSLKERIVGALSYAKEQAVKAWLTVQEQADEGLGMGGSAGEDGRDLISNLVSTEPGFEISKRVISSMPQAAITVIAIQMAMVGAGIGVVSDHHVGQCVLSLSAIWATKARNEVLIAKALTLNQTQALLKTVGSGTVERWRPAPVWVGLLFEQVNKEEEAVMATVVPVVRVEVLEFYRGEENGTVDGKVMPMAAARGYGPGGQRGVYRGRLGGLYPVPGLRPGVREDHMEAIAASQQINEWARTWHLWWS